MKKQQKSTSPRLYILVERYAEYLRELGLKPKSVQGSCTALRRFCSFLSELGYQNIADVTALDLEGYQLSLAKLTANSQQFYLVHARQFFRWLEDTQQLFLNPAIQLRIPKRPATLIAVPTEDQVARLLATPNLKHAAGLRDRAWLEVAYSTGARLIEMTRLTVQDVDLQRGLLRLFGKGDKERLVPLGSLATRWLEKYLREVRPKLLKEKSTPALWLSSHGGTPLSYVAIYRQLRTYARRTGLAKALLSPHSLRRACVTHMLNHGASPFLLKELLGHTRTATLNHYLRQNVADLKATHRRCAPGR